MNAIGRAACVALVAGVAAGAQAAIVIDDLAARHVGGQTFLTWAEAGLPPTTRLAVYRHAEPITPANLADATLLCRDLMPGTSCDFADLRRADYRRFTPLPRDGVRGAVVPWDGGTGPAAAAAESVAQPAPGAAAVRHVARRIAPGQGL